MDKYILFLTIIGKYTVKTYFSSPLTWLKIFNLAHCAYTTNNYLLILHPNFYTAIIHKRKKIVSILNIKRTISPSFPVSIVPIALLLVALVAVIVIDGADAVQNYSYYILSAAAAICILIGLATTRRKKCIIPGLLKSARQILPAVPILIFIGTLSATWMLSGVVPTLIDYGLELLNPDSFLLVACLTCAAISVVTGSSWTTIATIGVALLGVGTVMGYNAGWIAGAIISGAYFGDKVSPLSDTTVLAASTCGVPLLTHIRYLMLTSIPALAIALAVYTAVGYSSDLTASSHADEIIQAISSTFNITPWVLVIPAITIAMICLRAGTTLTLAAGSAAGLVGIWIFQPQIASELAGGDGIIPAVTSSLKILLTSTSLSTGSEILDPLVETGGVEGMLPTIYLVLSAMLFGGAMIGTGMLGTITHAITSRLRRAHCLIGATVGSGLFLNSCTGDQYLSIIIGANVYRNTYRRRGMKPQALSRTLEDSISVTSVLIPWNSCGVTQSTVLGVSTFVYMPFCLFNILSPIITMVMAWSGWRLHAKPAQTTMSAA